MDEKTLSVNSDLQIDPTTIRGWGVDANPDTDPTWPYRDRFHDDHSGAWERPSRQEADVEILQSIEHKQTPAVFGTSIPPSGLSGALRRLAFRKSESNLLHWVGLLGADRINMVEGVIQDFGRARIPNVAREVGGRAEWRYNKRGLALKAAVAAGMIALVAAAAKRRRGRR